MIQGSRGRVETEGEFQEIVRRIMRALRSVEAGELSTRIECEYVESEPMAALTGTLNAIVERYAQVREETNSYQREIEDQLATIERQRAAIRELSTPMIEVWAGVLCVPIVGMVDSTRAAEMTTALLKTVVDRKVVFAIIDVTGIDVMDTQATDHFLRMARAVRLLGAECVLSGINPNVARSITHMGVELAGIQSYRTLRDALQRHVTERQRPNGARQGTGITGESG